MCQGSLDSSLRIIILEKGAEWDKEGSSFSPLQFFLEPLLPFFFC